MKLTSRQKVLIPIIILAFIYISWQIYDMFFAKDQISQQSVVTTPATITDKDTKQLIHPAAPQIIAPQKKDVSELATINNPARQEAFAKLMRQYQALQSKRMLLQEEMAIAQTQHKIAALNAQLAQLGVTEASQPATTTISPHSSGYSLMYIDHQGGQWSAFLRKSDTPHKVKPGTKLSNNIQVISINSTGVLIEQDGKLTKLTFSGPVPVTKHTKKPTSIAKKPINKKKITLITHHRVITAKKRVAPKFIAPKIIPLKITKKPTNTVKAIEIAPHPVKLLKKTTNKKLVIKKSPEPNFSTHAIKPVLHTKLKPNFKITTAVNKKIASKAKSTFKINKVSKKTTHYRVISTKKPTIVHVVHLRSPKKMQANYRVKKLKPHLILTSSKTADERPIQFSPYPNSEAGLAN